MTFPSVPIGAIFSVKNGATPASGEGGYWDGDIPWVTPADLGALADRFISSGSRNISVDGYENCGTQMVPARSIILSIRAPIGHMAIARQSMCFNQGCRGLVPSSRIQTDFAYWALVAARPELEAAGQGTTFIELGRSKLRTVKLPLPDPVTQKAIASFLDRETARIDQLIANKERQITLLDQRARQAVTDVVIGKGDPSIPTIETGLEHMPRLPAHWLLRRAGLLFQQMAEPNDDDQPVLSVSIHTGISDRQLGDEERDRKVTLIEDRSSYKRVRPGYLAYNMMRAWQGGIGVSTVDGAVSPAYVVAKPTRNLHSPYYQFLLRTPAFIEQMRMGSKGIADFRLRLYWEQFRLIMLPVPPLEEQRRIATEAERELSHAAAVAAKVASSVERLKERRSALITAAVTGQIDLRGKVPTITTKSDHAKFRVIVGAEIIHRHQGNPKFGHVKLQKFMYLAEAHAGINELQGNYLREAAGPYDRALIEGLDRSLEAASFYRATKPEKIEEAVTYTPLAKAGQHSADLKTLLGTRTEGLKNLIGLLSDFDKRSVEAIATLYAVWNDAMMDGQTPDGDAIINGVLTEWHSEKGEKFKDADLRHWLDWMKRNKIVPRGEGPKTTPTITPRLL
jgi:restriction endonuclease S subunit